MSIKLNGLDDTLSSIDLIYDEEKIKSGLNDAVMIVEKDAKIKAPVGSGELRRSISSKIEGLEGTVFTALEYAPYIEYGTGLFAENGGRQDVPWSYKDAKGEWHTTSGIHPHPYMRPALKENKDKIINIIKEAITND